MTSGSVTNWIELFRTGDETAANHLWERYFSCLVSVARTKMVGMETQVEEAEDVALHPAFHAVSSSADVIDCPTHQTAIVFGSCYW